MFKYKEWLLPYCDSLYNDAPLNERAIEIPVGKYYWERGMMTGRSILEIGAVLPHYIDNPGHTVVDLYEIRPGVINEDILSWQPDNPYDLIVSISTLEHLGGPGRTVEAVYRLRGWLKRDGEMFITLPFWDYITPELIAALKADHVVRYDKVDPVNHLWAEADQSTPPLTYDGPSKWANSVWFLVYHA